MTEYLKSELNDGVLELTLARPEKKNALNQAMYTALVDALDGAEANRAVKVVLLSGEGESFTSGNDLADFAAAGTLASASNPILQFIDIYGDFSKPVIVAVNGDCVGIGTTLLMHSDLVYAEPNTRFSLPFVKLGLCPEFASAYLMPRVAGHAKAFEWLVLGEPFSADEALQFGIVNAIADCSRELARKKAREVAALPPAAVVESKRLMRIATSMNTSQLIKEEAESFSKALSGPEFAEAVKAFFEKRKPDFSTIE